MNQERFYFLLNAYKNSQLTQEQWQELRPALQSGEFDDYIRQDLLLMMQQRPSGESAWTLQAEETIWAGIRERLDLNNIPPVSSSGNRWSTTSFVRYAAAVVLVLAGVSAAYIFFRPSDLTPVAVNNNTVNDVSPGGDKAVLTLADGSMVMLDSSSAGSLAQQGGTQIIQLGGGQLTYASGRLDKKLTGELLYNTIATPNGGQYQIILPDSSKVWINAASQLKFPVAFVGNDRRVQLSGEAYFEITPNASKPFIVEADQLSIQVLGTSFNVMAYADEAVVKTTLVTGAVKVNTAKGSRLLEPGTQALTDRSDIVVKKADVDLELGWKNGYFQFDKADIKTIMRQLTRWYDIKVEYQGSLPSNRFKGTIPRQASLTKAIRILELSGVKCKWQGDRLIVGG